MPEQENISVVVEDSVTDKPSVIAEQNSEPVKVEETTPTTVTDRMVGVPLSTLIRCTNLIDALSRRGCFRANEMKDVGGLYNTITLVVNNTVNQIRAEQVLPKDGDGDVVSTEESSEESV